MRSAAIAEGSSCTSSVLVHKWEVRSSESLFLSLSPDAWTSRCRPSAPEVVARHRYGRPVDCWAVGVIMFILWVPIRNYWSFYRAIQDTDYYPNNCRLQFVTDIYRSCGQSFDITIRFISFVFFYFSPSLSGNPPFYDETEEENTDLHNRIIFCRIVAGDFEFDSPYWDDISPAGT